MFSVYRNTPWGVFNNQNDFHSYNKYRVVNTWIDSPYADITRAFLRDKNFTVSDVTERRWIRAKNHCKPYSHYVNTVKSFSDTYLPINIKHKGQLYNPETGMCLDTAKQGNNFKLVMYFCYEIIPQTQFFIYTPTKQIRAKQASTLSVNVDNARVIDTLQRFADNGEPETKWTLMSDGSIVSDFNGFCITATLPNESPVLDRCKGSARQRWVWKEPRERAGQFPT